LHKILLYTASITRHYGCVLEENFTIIIIIIKLSDNVASEKDRTKAFYKTQEVSLEKYFVLMLAINNSSSSRTLID
jgi:hypothetical protein